MQKCFECLQEFDYLINDLCEQCGIDLGITKEGNKMSEQMKLPGMENASSTQSQKVSSKWNFIIILIASQVQGFAAAFKKKDAHLSSWLFWAGKALQAFITGEEMSDEPSGIDDFDSPLSDSFASAFVILGFQLRSLSQAIAMYDDDDLGRDDAFAHLLARISSVLITLGNK